MNMKNFIFQQILSSTQRDILKVKGKICHLNFVHLEDYKTQEKMGYPLPLNLLSSPFSFCNISLFPYLCLLNCFCIWMPLILIFRPKASSNICISPVKMSPLARAFTVLCSYLSWPGQFPSEEHSWNSGNSSTFWCLNPVRISY